MKFTKLHSKSNHDPYQQSLPELQDLFHVSNKLKHAVEINSDNNLSMYFEYLVKYKEVEKITINATQFFSIEEDNKEIKNEDLNSLINVAFNVLKTEYETPKKNNNLKEIQPIDDSEITTIRNLMKEKLPIKS